jgi:hypothetical protein
METTKKESRRAGTNASIAAVMGIVIGLIAGVSLSHSSVPAGASLKARSAAIAAPSSQAGTDAVATNDVSDLQLD